ncbi:endolytic transglycosylase MltG [Alphaproteobacteria bacterium US3C007]|nr:endolytic transglycosylase MltG [Alphaproteobacteria bacterium US3C007]
MWRSAASNALTFLILVFLLIGAFALWGQAQYFGAGPLSEAKCLLVDRGQTMRKLSQKLDEMGALSQPAIFRIGSEYENKTAQLKAGSFLIPQGSSMREIADIVTRGGANTCGTEIVFRLGINTTQAQIREMDPVTQKLIEIDSFELSQAPPAAYKKAIALPGLRFRLTMAEGITSWQVVEALSNIDILTGDILEIPAEGSLATISYELRNGDTRTGLLQRMIQTQESYLGEAWALRAEGLPLSTPQEALILASIIEKETAMAAERRLVASVFINRLNRGMPLQTDPTVIYGITKGQTVLGRGLRRSELRKDTPWNTYTNKGLPPTPIANPGKASIEAALNPETTNLVFFVADGTGGHAFAETLAEHNKNVAKWRKIEAVQSE